MHLECERCKGIGLVIKHPCLDCKTAGIKIQQVTERVSIPAGVDNGQTITLNEKVKES
jgi:molecular chaperone DnaJ